MSDKAEPRGAWAAWDETTETVLAIFPGMGRGRAAEWGRTWAAFAGKPEPHVVQVMVTVQVPLPGGLTSPIAWAPDELRAENQRLNALVARWENERSEKVAGLMAERDLAVSHVRALVDAWSAEWDCTADPFHAGVDRAVGAARAALEAQPESGGLAP